MLAEPHTDFSAPWKLRFRLPETFGMQIAEANPTCGLVVTNTTSQYQLYAWHTPTGRLRRLTNKADGAWFGVLSPDGRYVYYLDDQKGDEIGHLVRIPYEGEAIPEDITPDMQPYAVPFESEVVGLSISHSANMLGFSIATDDGFHLYCSPLDPTGKLGELRKLYDAEKLVVGPRLSYDGEIAVLASTEFDEGLQYTLLAFDIASGQLLGKLQDQNGSVHPFMFSPVRGDMRFLATTNRTGYSRPLLWNPRTGERLDIPLEDLEGEIYPCDWSSNGAHLLLKQFSRAVPQLYIYNIPDGTYRQLNHPAYGYIGAACFSSKGELFVNCVDSTKPGQIVALDQITGKQSRVLLATTESIPGRSLRSVSFTSSDGQSIQAWVGVPEGNGPFPTILETHGGPDAVATGSFWPWAQSWLDHGFAYITVNYRGSTSFGRAFQEQIWGEVGHWEVEDMVAARNWLIENSIADPAKIFLTGWSYGGYLTLHALSIYPDLWAGGMAGVAIADCTLAYEDEADTLKAYDVTLFKGTPQEKPELYRKASPITYAEQVKAPILIIQGRNDTRCPPRQIEVYEERMKVLGKDIEVHWYDAGHISTNVEQQIAHQERMIRFAYRVLRI